MSRAMATGFCESTAVIVVPLATRRTETTRVFASGLKAALMPSSQARGALGVRWDEAQAASIAAAMAAVQAIRMFTLPYSRAKVRRMLTTLLTGAAAGFPAWAHRGYFRAWRSRN